MHHDHDAKRNHTLCLLMVTCAQPAVMHLRLGAIGIASSRTQVVVIFHSFMQSTLDLALFYMTKAYKCECVTRKAQYQAESMRLYDLYKQGR